jgi:hypothetical protein
MSRSSAIFLMATMLFVDGACWLHHIRSDREAALIDEIAIVAELNQMDLHSLGNELENLAKEADFALENLPIFYEHFRVCSTWKVKRANHR